VRKTIALAAMLIALDRYAYAQNASQNTVDKVGHSVTIAMTSTWQLVAAADPNRKAMLCQNVGTHNMGFLIQPYASGSATPTASGIGSADVFTLLPNGAYEPDGGWICGGAVWVIGTANDVMTCYF